jgi:hypothetical protein
MDNGSGYYTTLIKLFPFFFLDMFAKTKNQKKTNFNSIAVWLDYGITELVCVCACAASSKAGSKWNTGRLVTNKPRAGTGTKKLRIKKCFGRKWNCYVDKDRRIHYVYDGKREIRTNGSAFKTFPSLKLIFTKTSRGSCKFQNQLNPSSVCNYTIFLAAKWRPD